LKRLEKIPVSAICFLINKGPQGQNPDQNQNLIASLTGKPERRPGIGTEPVQRCPTPLQEPVS